MINDKSQHAPDHHGFTRVGTNFIISGWIESPGEGVKK